MFYSIADRFSESHSISLGGSETDFVLVFVDIVLLVATDVVIRQECGQTLGRVRVRTVVNY